ncbi:MAG: hypothetical protein HXX80_01020 [Nitrososphaerales archaeon]|nr:hypothetical protein [Nitrososphaerales archaeon]
MKAILNKKAFSIFVATIFLISVLAVPVVLAVPKPVSKYNPYAKGNGQAGKSNIAYLYLVEKNPADWTIVPDGAWGKMKYNLAGPTFDYVFNGHGLDMGMSYSLIYYPEPQNMWPWPMIVIASGLADSDGNIHLAGSYDFEQDLTDAKIWLVLSDDIVGGSLSGWSPTEYLFEYDLINYDDMDVSDDGVGDGLD